MSTNHTTNYNLNQWEAADKVLRTDFNADNAKIDAALKGLSDQVAGKAAQSAVDALTQSVSGKANQSDVTALSQTVAEHTAALAEKGNCMIYTTSYTGNGKMGSSDRSSLTFPAKPQLVLIVQDDSLLRMLMCRGITVAENNNTAMSCTVSWSSTGVSWYANSAAPQMNAGGETYRVFALLSCD